MRYIQLKIYTSRQGVEMVSQVLLNNGIDQISVDDPADMDDILNKKNEYDWDYFDDSLKENADREPVVCAYLDDSEESDARVHKIKEDMVNLKAEEKAGTFGPEADFGKLSVEVTIVDDEDWKDKWKENFKPTKITNRIVVKPTWEAYTAADDEVILEIDPGMAFGTGTHETTSLCMKLLEKYILAGNPEEIKVLDVGCGSGILAISAALLGCKNILGVEIDTDAVEIAKENVELNKVADSVICQYGDLTEGIDFSADIIVANLMHNLVMMLAPSALKHMEPGAVFISSGILIEKRDQVAASITESGFEIVEILEDGEWCAIVAKAK